MGAAMESAARFGRWVGTPPAARAGKAFLALACAVVSDTLARVVRDGEHPMDAVEDVILGWAGAREEDAAEEVITRWRALLPR